MRKLLNPWIIWFPAALFYFYQFMLRVSPGVMKDDLMRDFSIDGGTFGLLASCYYFGYCALQIPVGLLCDYFGPRKLLTFAAFLCAIATVFFALSTQIYMAGFWRFLIGVGSSCAFLGCMKLGTLWFPLERLPMITSGTMILGTLGANFGGAPLRILINYYDWRGSLLIVAIFGVLIGFAIWMISRDRETDDSQENPTIFAGLKLVITTPQVWVCALYGFLLYTPLSVFADLWGVGFLERAYSISPEEAAFYVNFIYIGLGLGGIFYAWFLSMGLITIVSGLQLTTVSVGILMTIIFLVPNIPLNVMWSLLFILGFVIAGEGLIFSFACSHVPVHFSGVTIGFTNMLTMLSGLLLQPIVGKILDMLSKGKIVDGVRLFEVADYRVAFLVILLCIVGSFFISFFFKEKHAA